MTPHFRAYRPDDRDACLALFDANCPEFFAPNERADYIEFLSDNDHYEVCVVDDEVVGAFGVGAHGAGGLAVRWILVSPATQGQGLGSMIMRRVIEGLRERGVDQLHIATSHKSAPFFARFGAKEVTTTLDGWGPAMHRVDMLLATR